MTSPGIRMERLVECPRIKLLGSKTDNFLKGFVVRLATRTRGLANSDYDSSGGLEGIPTRIDVLR